MSKIRNTAIVMLLATLAVCLVGPAAIYLGGPKPVVALGSVNQPFKNLDYSALSH